MTDTQVMAALEPCPFCGSPAKLISRPEFWVECTKKGVCIANGSIQPGGCAYAADAINLWNHRIASSPAGDAEPVAWMYDNGKHDPVVHRTREPYLTQIGYTETALGPLYATPVSGDAALRKALADAYAKGAEDVHAEWLRAHAAGEGPPRGDPEFGEAAGDYADAALDPFSSAARLATPPSVPAQQGERECPSSPDGRHQVDTSMESGFNHCFHCERPMPGWRLPATPPSQDQKGVGG